MARQFAATVRGQVPCAFRCGRCSHAAIALVEATGEGRGSSLFWLDSDSAKEVAHRRALHNLVEAAERTLVFAVCPACGQRDEAKVVAVGLTATVKLVAAALLPMAPAWLVGWARAGPWGPLGLCLSCMVAWYGVRTLRRAGHATAGKRVRFLSHAEVVALSRSSVAEPG